jgi:tRNA pseudouridine38-40 synthase
MPTWKMVIEYKGTKYRGWQEQTNAVTVQGELHRAVEAVLGHRAEIVGAGRTDAGVHALGQVAHLKTRETLPAALLCRHINDHLPAEINVRDVVSVEGKFHARHDAIERYYLYQIATRRTAFAKPFVWWIKDRLDADAMKQAARHLVGRHNFSGFCETLGKEEGSTLVEVISCELQAQGDLILFRICASHFLWKMVRRVVGVLAEIGRGKLQPSDMRKLIQNPSDDVAAWTAPPSGLFLEYIRYSGDPPPDPLSPAFFFR